jgi:hypothetical protein
VEGAVIGEPPTDSVFPSDAGPIAADKRGRVAVALCKHLILSVENEVQWRRQPILENRFLPSKVFDIYPASHNANNQKHGEIARDIGACHG